MPGASELIVASHVSRIHGMQEVHPLGAVYHTTFTISGKSALIEEIPFERRKARAKALSTRRLVWLYRNG
jgi:hypothetical protein